MAGKIAHPGIPRRTWVGLVVALVAYMLMFPVPARYSWRRFFAGLCATPSAPSWTDHATWAGWCAHVFRTESVELLTYACAFLTFAVAGVLLASRGYRFLRFVPALAAALAEALYISVPYTPASIGLWPGWANDRMPLWFRHDALGAVIVGLLLAVPLALAGFNRQARKTDWPLERILAVVVAVFVANLLVQRVAPEGSEVILITAFLVGFTGSSRRQFGYSLGWAVLPVVVTTLGNWPWEPAFSSPELRFLFCLVAAVSVGALADPAVPYIVRVIGREGRRTAQAGRLAPGPP